MELRSFRMVPCLWLLLPLLLLMSQALSTAATDPVIDRIWPQNRGGGGASALTISGSNLKKQFQLSSKPEDGYSCYFVSDDEMESYEVNILNGYIAIDGTSLVGSTSAMPTGWYNLECSVDGKAAKKSRSLRAQSLTSHTPTIVSIVISKTLGSYKPRPGQEFVTVCGRILTSYINGTEFGERNTTNGITARLIAVYAGQHLCDKTDERGDPLPIFLNGVSGESKDGCFTALCNALDVGMHNLTYIIGEEFGRSVTDGSLTCSDSSGEIGNYEKLPVIESMDIDEGSPSGGTNVTFVGDFGSSVSDIYVKFADTSGTIMKRDYDKTTKKTTLIVSTPAKPSSTCSYCLGGRGVRVDIFEQNAAVANDTAALDVVLSDPVTTTEHPDTSRFTYTGNTSHVVGHMNFYYVPGATGLHDFYMKTCNDASASPTITTAVASFKLSQTDMDPNQKQSVTVRTFDKTALDTQTMVNLTAGKGYYVEAIFYGTKGACVNISVFTCNTPYNEGQLCGAYNQREDIIVSSTDVNAKQTFDLSSWGSNPTVTHAFTISISTAGSNFRLCIAKSCTVPIRTEDGATILKHLKELPTLGSTESVDSVTPTTAATSFTVTIKSENAPTLEVVAEDMTATSAVSVTGPSPAAAASGKELVFNVDSHRSPPITMTAGVADPTKMASALSTMLSVRCPTTIPPSYRGPTGVISPQFYYQDYEGSSGSCEEEPFCGSKSYSTLSSYIDLYNSKTLIPAHTQTHVGFAYILRGCDLNSKIYYYANVVTDSHNFTWWREIPYNFTSDGKWHYTVLDLKSQILDDHDQYIAAGTENNVKANVKIVRVHRNKYCTDPRARISVDEVYVGLPDNSITITDLPALRSVPPVRSKTVTVTKNGDNYTVEVERCNCPVLSPMAVEGAPPSWVTATNTQTATTAVAGTFDLERDGETISSIDVTISEQNLKKELESKFSDMGTVDVEKISNRYSCTNFKFRVTYLTSGGCQPPMTIPTKSLTGTSPDVTTSLVQLGGDHKDPPSGSHTRVPHNVTQALVFVDKWLPARCENDTQGNCKFQYNSALQVIITSVSPAQGKNGDTLTLTGQAFDNSDVANNVVKIGTALCAVTSVPSATSIVCTLGPGKAGDHAVDVFVKGNGKAVPNTTPAASFEYQLTVSTIAPTSGSLVGCTLLTVTGDGFDLTVKVTVGGTDCPIANTATDITQTTIKCQVPARTGSATTVDVVVTVGTSPNTKTKTLTNSYTYDAAATYTPVITSIEDSSGTAKTTADAWGGESLTIKGTGLTAGGTVVPTVTVGSKQVTIITSSDTTITLTLPALPPGDNEVKVYVSNKGCAAQSNILPKLTVTFAVTQVCPSVCSGAGGCTFTITGPANSFPTVSPENKLKVNVGPTPCTISGSTSSTLTCKMDRVFKYHDINYNSKAHQWEPKHLTVQVGECIVWKWTVSPFAKHKVRTQQIDSPTSTTKVSNGFQSNPATSGSYTWCVGQTAAKIYYWSTYIDAFQSIAFHGTFTVVTKPAQTATMVIAVKSDEQVQPTTTGITNCASNPTPCPTVASPTAGTGLNIMLDNAYAPIVTSMSVSQTYVPFTITFTGTNFGTSCVTGVTVGSHAATLGAATSTSIEATLPATAEPESYKTHDVVLTHGNGYPLVRGSLPGALQVNVTAAVTALTPTEGSTAGCTELTISGKGFKDGKTEVSINNVPCTIPTGTPVTYSEIKCRTGAHAASSTLDVKVVVDGQEVPCVPSTGCKFEYKAANTPGVTSISPNPVAAGGTLTVIGTGLTASTEVTIGTSACTSVAAISNGITCTAPSLPAVNKVITVRRVNWGCALFASSVTPQLKGTASLTTVTPTDGSIHGGNVITLRGSGFDDPGTTVMVGSNVCNDVDVVSTTELKCTTPDNGASGSVLITVTAPSDFASVSGVAYSYVGAKTPVVNTINGAGTASGVAGDTITLVGTNFGATAADNTVKVGAVACSSVALPSANTLTCTVGRDSPGAKAVVVTVADSGSSDPSTTVKFTHTQTLTSVLPNTGSTAGGTKVAFTGNSLFATATMALCGQTCTDCVDVTNGVSCTSPPGTHGTVCPATVTYPGVTPVTLANAYTYSSSRTPDISGVSQRRGGTAGGVSLTISGTNFGTNCADLTVTIENIDCHVTDCNNTAVVCLTGPVPKNVSFTTRCTTNIAAVQNIQLHRKSYGLATESLSLADGNPDFQYIDVWSSPYTWGGDNPPVGADLVVIPPEQTILLDVSTPVLKLVLVQGCLIFDDSPSTGRVKLEAEYVLINDGGLVQAKPKCGYFNEIILHGGPRSQELPLYGAKALAVRNGTLDMHGCPTPVTWTELKETVGPGDKVITLKTPVENWMVGFWIIITTTKDHRSQHETEKRKISSISSDGLTIELDTGLLYTHYAIIHTLANGDKVKCLQSYVGLLSHNARVEGSDDPQFHTVIPACPTSFKPDRFAKQACFQGRFGAEVGSDQFGCHIMLHSARPDTNEAVARLVSVEIHNCGQAFRLGRYPLHFHNLGDCGNFSEVCTCVDNGTISYLRDSSIHKSFNRAVNIHGTCNVLITNNVVYDIMGGSLFFEDSVEQANTLSYNLVVFVKPSSSLQVDDQTPAAFWLTNAVNCIIHNVAIGNYGFGFWYRIEDPQGSNQHAPIKPMNQLICKFYNNTANFNGRYGLWVFEFYFPKGGVAVFDTFNACCNLRGAESGDSSLIRFTNFVLANNYAANLEMLLNYKSHVPTSVRYDKDLSFAVRDSKIIGQLEFGPAPSKLGLVLPFDSGLAIDNVEFHNFLGALNEGLKSCAIGLVKIICTCSNLCGAYEYGFSNISWYNTTHKARTEWEHEWALADLDGTLTQSTPGVSVVANSDLLPSTCTKSVTEWSVGGPYNGAICPAGIYFVKFNFNNLIPESLTYKDVIIQNQDGKITQIIWRKLSRDYAKGYFALLPVYKISDGRSCATYTMWFENAEQISNISYKAQWTGLQDTCVILCHNVTQDVYDRVNILLKNNPGESPVPLSSSSTNGQYTFYNNTLCYIISDGPTHRNVEVHIRAERCFYTNCTPPVDAATVPPSNSRPSIYCLWSDANAWSTCGNSWTVGSTGRRKRSSGVGVPTAGAKITIGNYTVLDLNGTLPCFESIVVEKGGTLDVEPSNDVNICATYIVIEGGGRLIVGREGAPATGQIEIRLLGDHSTAYFPTTGGPVIGSKVLAAFGGVDIHGLPQDPQWTSLSATANVGDNKITIRANVSGSWKIDDEIVIAPTSYSPWETETFTITDIDASGSVLTLNTTLRHKHLAYSDTACDGTAAGACLFAAEVGHFTRNVKIIGVDGGNMISQSFGGRVLVASKSGGIGYGRFSNVEFRHCGQEGFTEMFDPHCAVAFLNTGPVTDIKPSYIHSNSFPHSLGQIICVYGAENFTISNNVLHHAIGQGIKTDANHVTVKYNLVVLIIWPGAYQNRKETTNKNLGAAIETNRAQNVILEHNAVAGCERAGYRIDGESCYSDSVWFNNTVHSGIIGIAIIPPLTPQDVQDGFPGEDCSKISGFRAWRMYGFGVYTQVTLQSIIVENSMFCENGVGVFNMIVGPGVKGHGFVAHSIRVQNCTFVGTAPGFDCANDKPDTGSGGADADNFGLAGVYLSRCKKEGKVGICHLFSSAGNLFPFKPVILAKMQPAMYGISYVNDTCFAHWNLTCPSRGRDTMISYNQLSKDMDFSFKLSHITLENVHRSSIVWIPYPDPNTAMVEKCGTTACDGPRKFIVTDLDGTTLGCNGSLLPEMDYQWDNDTRFGLGDYRIPKVALVDVYDRKRNISEVYQHRGIIGAKEHGSWDDESHTYLVCDQEYVWFSTESLDSDFKTRIFSPTFVRAKNVTTNMTTGYITIQPSDAGICGGYACMERPGYQQKPISPGHCYEVIYTGTTPQNLRVHFPYTSSTQSFKLCIYYSSPQALNVYVLYDVANNKKRYILPVNGYHSNGEIAFHPKNYHQFALSITGNATGANIFDYDTKMLCMIVRGPQPLIIQTKTTILLKSGLEMTVDEFFGKNIVQNLAYFLQIPANKVRVVNIVAANSGATGRKKRSVTDVVDVIIQISDSAPEVGGTQSLDYAALTNVYNILIEGFQTGSLQTALGNITFTYFQVSPPVPSHDTQLYADLVAFADKNGEPLGGETTITVPDVMHLYGQPVGGYEGGPFTKYAALRVLDEQGDVVPVLVTNNGPWTITANLDNYNGQATLTGSTTIPFTKGLAIFSDISISDTGNYTLAFELTNPTSFNKIARIVAPTPVVITKRPLTLYASVTHSATVSKNFHIDLVVKDPSGSVVTDLDWKGHTWTYTLRLHPAFVANLGGTLSGSVNNSGLTSSENITLDKTGYFSVEVLVSSQPAGYDLQAQALVNVVPTNYVPPTVQTSATLSITFDVGSTVLLQPNAFRAHFANQLQAQLGPGSVLSQITISGTGPYTVGFVVSGTEVGVNTTLNNLGSYVNQSCPALSWLNVTLSCTPTLLVNGTPFYPVPTTPTPKPVPADVTLALVLGICIPVGVILIIVITVICVIKRGKITRKPSGGVVAASPEPGRKEGALMFTSQSGLLSSRAASMVSQNPAGRAPQDTSFSSTEGSASSSPNLNSSTTGLLSNRTSTPNVTPPSSAVRQRSKTPKSSTSLGSAKSWKSRLSLSRGGKKGKPLQVTPRGTPSPAHYDDPPPPSYHSEDSAVSQTSKQGVNVSYSPREIRFNMSDVS